MQQKKQDKLTFEIILVLQNLISMNTQVSSKGVYAFVFLFSWPPEGLEISPWAIFNCPFCVDFENIIFFIFCLKLDRDNGKILQVGD